MLEINLTKNTNDAIQGTLGKYYGRVEYKGTLGVKDLAKIMKKHTTAFSLGEITGMLLDLASLIKEYALMGYVVKIDDLGLFKASIDANGLTLEEGSRVSAGRGAQKTDEQLAEKPDTTPADRGQRSSTLGPSRHRSSRRRYRASWPRRKPGRHSTAG